jgi:hypothetical protein
MQLSKSLDTKRETILNNEVELAELEQQFEVELAELEQQFGELVERKDHEAALQVANTYAAKAQETGENVDEFMMHRAEKLHGRNAMMDPDEVNQLGEYSKWP